MQSDSLSLILNLTTSKNHNIYLIQCETGDYQNKNRKLTED